jgi:hypothetical protein
MTLNNINWNDVKDEKEQTLLPNLIVPAMITGAEYKTPGSGGPEYLSIEYTIAEGEFKDRKVWDSLYLNSANTTAVNIARSRLKSTAIAVGVNLATFSEPEELLNRLCSIKIGTQAAKGEYPAKNVIKKVEAFGAAVVPQGNEKNLDLAGKGDDIPF